MIKESIRARTLVVLREDIGVKKVWGGMIPVVGSITGRKDLG